MNNQNNKNQYIIDYANVDAGIGHSMGLFNAFIKVALMNGLIPAYSKKQLKKTKRNSIKFILKKLIKPMLGKTKAETHDLGDTIDDFFKIGINAVTREAVEKKIKNRELKIIRLPQILDADKAIDDKIKYHDINNVITSYKDEEGIVFILPEKREVDCEYKLTGDWFIEKYKKAREIAPIQSYFDEGKINVAIHIRRGDLLPNRSFSHLSNRMLPDKWYAMLIDKLYELYKEKLVIHLYAQGTNGVYLNENGIQNDWNNYKEIRYPVKINLHLDEPWTVDLHHMINANVLVTCKSGFSHLGGMLNRSGIKITPPMWHSFKGANYVIEIDDQSGEYDTNKLMRFSTQLFNLNHLR